MADITLRTGETGKGAPLTLEQVDQNFININAELGLKLNISDFTGSAVLTRLLTVDTDFTGLNATSLQSLVPSSSLPTTAIKTSVVSRDTDGNFGANIITSNLIGDVTGNVEGDILGNSTGVHTGEVIGNVTGNVDGNLNGNSTGTHTGDVVGNVTGNVVGNVTGTLTGPSIGLHTGTVIGNVTGNLTGNASTVTNGVYTTGSYANPSWLTALNGNKLYSSTVPNSALVNSSVTINGSSVALGGSITVFPGFGGDDYSWQNLTTTRLLETNYTNTSGHIIWVSATIESARTSGSTVGGSWGDYIIAYVDGMEVARDRDNGSATGTFQWYNTGFFVPAGSVYSIQYYRPGTSAIGTVKSWTEFR